MMSLLTAVIACNDPTISKHLAAGLGNLGITIVGQGKDYWQSLHIILEYQPGVVVLHHSLPRATIMEIIQFVDEHRLAPVVVVTDSKNGLQLNSFLDKWIFSYLPEPVEENCLAAAINSGRAYFQRLKAVEQDNQELKQTLENRKILDKAKNLLMTKKGVSEQQAYRYLQKESMNKCVPIPRIAEQVIVLLEKKDR